MNIINIGSDYRTDSGDVVRVQDRDVINQIALVGGKDVNGIIWDSYWVSWDRLAESGARR